MKINWFLVALTGIERAKYQCRSIWLPSNSLQTRAVCSGAPARKALRTLLVVARWSPSAKKSAPINRWRSASWCCVILPIMRTNEQIKAEVREVISETPEARYFHRLSCIELMAQGISYARVAKAFGHSPSTLTRWWRKYREGGVGHSARRLAAGENRSGAGRLLSVRRRDESSRR